MASVSGEEGRRGQAALGITGHWALGDEVLGLPTSLLAPGCSTHNRHQKIRDKALRER